MSGCSGSSSSAVPWSWIDDGGPTGSRRTGMQADAWLGRDVASLATAATGVDHEGRADDLVQNAGHVGLAVR